jgi:hypothetical protein
VWGWFLECVAEEPHDRDADAGVGNVKRGPWVRYWDMQIEEQKIDYVAMHETIGEVSHDASQEQGERNVAQCVGRTLSKEQRQNNKQGDAGEHDKKRVVVPE